MSIIALQVLSLNCCSMLDTFQLISLSLIVQKEGVLAAVDATLAKDLAKRFEIKGFPTLKYFR